MLRLMFIEMMFGKIKYKLFLINSKTLLYLPLDDVEDIYFIFIFFFTSVVFLIYKVYKHFSQIQSWITEEIWDKFVFVVFENALYTVYKKLFLNV